MSAVKQLIAMCDEPVEGLGGKKVIPEHIYLNVQKANLPKGKSIRLANGGRGPLGRICTVNEGENGGYVVVAVFKRAEVKAFALSLSSAVEKAGA